LTNISSPLPEAPVTVPAMATRLPGVTCPASTSVTTRSIGAGVLPQPTATAAASVTAAMAANVRAIGRVTNQRSRSSI
jgi:hypothetical protein